MSPYQHGEVYVLDDGSETDLDLGHYERFTNSPADPRLQLHHRPDLPLGDQQGAAGRVPRPDRAGDPAHHQRDQGRACAKLDGPDVDVVITEIGGTVGDIESQPFLEAIRQFSLDVGKENCLYIHLTLVPYLKAAAELKTKPTQHSVGQLRQIGIQPDILICRTERSLSRDDRAKIALFCNVPVEAVIEEKDKDFSIYEVPMSLVEHGLDELIVRKLGLQGRRAEPRRAGATCCTGSATRSTRSASPWWASTPSTATPTSRSTRPWTTRGMANRAQVRIQRVHSEAVEREGPERLLSGVDGVLVPGGFGERGIEGKIDAIRFARATRHPLLRHLPGDAVRGGRVRPQRARPRAGQLDRVRQEQPPPGDLPAGRAEDDHRQGRHDAAGGPAGQARRRQPARPSATAAETISERHRHRYEFNNVYRQQFAAHGHGVRRHQPRRQRWWRSSRLPDHPWFVAVQFHPEFKSQPTRPHPLFAGFIGAAVAASRSTSGAAETEPIELGVLVGAIASDDEPNRTPEKKIIVDEDWKSQVEAEKRPCRAAGPPTGRRPPPAAASRLPAAEPLLLLANTLYLQAAIALGCCPTLPGSRGQRVRRSTPSTRWPVLRRRPRATARPRRPRTSNMLHQLRLAYLSVRSRRGRREGIRDWGLE